MTKTAKTVTSAATRILKSRTASKAEKAVAATALTQTKSAKEPPLWKMPLWKRDGSIMAPDYASIDLHNQATGERVIVESDSPRRAELLFDCILKALNQ